MANGPVPSVDVLVAENARLRVELDAAAVLVGQLIGATAAFEARLSAFQEQASSQAERIATLEALVAEPRRGGKRQAESAWVLRVFLTLETGMMEHGNYRCAAEAAEVSGRAA